MPGFVQPPRAPQGDVGGLAGKGRDDVVATQVAAERKLGQLVASVGFRPDGKQAAFAVGRCRLPSAVHELAPWLDDHLHEAMGIGRGFFDQFDPGIGFDDDENSLVGGRQVHDPYRLAGRAGGGDPNRNAGAEQQGVEGGDRLCG